MGKVQDWDHADPLAITNPQVQAALTAMPGSTHAVWQYFGLFLDTPRPSHKLEAITARLVALAKQWEADNEAFKHRLDDAGNIVFERLGNPALPTIVFQGHMDMVTVSTDDFDFENEELPVYYHAESATLRSKGTTLGSDNGIGVAMGLALLRDAVFDNDATRPTMQLLITANEETDMSGATNLAGPPFLTPIFVVNLDSEEAGRVCCGSAGGFEVDVLSQILTSDASAAAAEDVDTLVMTYSNFRGGHTGVDIHKDIPNVLLHMVATVANVVESLDVGKSVFVLGLQAGSASNAIPNSGSIVLGARKGQDDIVKTLLAALQAAAAMEVASAAASNGGDSGQPQVHVVSHDVSQVKKGLLFCADKQPVISWSAISPFLKSVLLFPQGPLLLQTEEEGGGERRVLTSSSVSTLEASTTEAGVTLSLRVFVRSSVHAELTKWEKYIRDIASRTDAVASVSDLLCAFPPWDPAISREAGELMQRAFVAAGVADTLPEIYSIHAGLESGLIVDKYPSAKVVSVGPDITGAHSPDEALFVATVEPCYKAVVKFVELVSVKE